MTLISLIRATRYSSGLSLNKLADKVGIGRHVMRDYINGKRSPSKATLEKITRIAKGEL